MKHVSRDAERLVVEESMSSEEAAELAGKLLDESYYDHLIEDDRDVYTAEGELVLKFRRRAIDRDVALAAYGSLRDAAVATDNRGIAGGELSENKLPVHVRKNVSANDHSKHRFRYLKKDGTLSKTNYANTVNSGIIGYFDRNPRFPYCRQTAYNLNHPEKFAKAMPYFQQVAEVFRICVPEKYEAQMEVVKRTQPDWIISGTPFTTITVNKNWQTATHMDQGDLKEGFGVLSCFRSGVYTGGYLVFPKYRVAVNLSTRDVLMANVGHEWHGNTPIKGRPGQHERLSCVFYYRTRMQYCGTPEEELEMAKRRRQGDPVNKARPEDILGRETQQAGERNDGVEA